MALDEHGAVWEIAEQLLQQTNQHGVSIEVAHLPVLLQKVEEKLLSFFLAFLDFVPAQHLREHHIIIIGKEVRQIIILHIWTVLG